MTRRPEARFLSEAVLSATNSSNASSQRPVFDKPYSNSPGPWNGPVSNPPCESPFSRPVRGALSKEPFSKRLGEPTFCRFLPTRLPHLGPKRRGDRGRIRDGADFQRLDTGGERSKGPPYVALNSGESPRPMHSALSKCRLNLHVSHVRRTTTRLRRFFERDCRCVNRQIATRATVTMRPR
ncbi:hypothetical protein M885DRAFT_1897 [Pelagophyceae sp. CCMP2097]|nr:hypothetical protein M885DRAFT_1897 [Pelagophyceae sp. CCMP2097]